MGRKAAPGGRCTRLALHEVPHPPAISECDYVSDRSSSFVPHTLIDAGDYRWRIAHSDGRVLTFIRYRPQAERDAGAKPWAELYSSLEL